MRNLKELHFEGLSREFRFGPPAEDDIVAFEKALGNSLPATYLELLRFQNGGIPGCNIVIPMSDVLKPYQSLHILYSLTSDINDITGVWWNYYNYSSLIPEGYFAFANDLGSDLFLLNSREEGGSIHFQPLDEGSGIHKVANTFEEFIDCLLPFSDLPKVDPLFELGEDGVPRLKR